MKAKTITCTKCHAPLALLGNLQRCRNLVCQYCGTVMDTRNEFKALYSFTHIQNKNSQLRIGMQAKIQQVIFEVVGFITYACDTSQWIQFQLYSYTHGYAVLLQKNNCILFLRKTHFLPDKNLWLLKNKDNFNIDNELFSIKSFYFAEIYYAAGNLTETVKQGTRNKQCFANSSEHWFHSIHRPDYIENYIGYTITNSQLQQWFNLKKGNRD